MNTLQDIKKNKLIEQQILNLGIEVPVEATKPVKKKQNRLNPAKRELVKYIKSHYLDYDGTLIDFIDAVNEEFGTNITKGSMIYILQKLNLKKKKFKYTKVIGNSSKLLNSFIIENYPTFKGDFTDFYNFVKESLNIECSYNTIATRLSRLKSSGALERGESNCSINSSKSKIELPVKKYILVHVNYREDYKHVASEIKKIFNVDISESSVRMFFWKYTTKLVYWKDSLNYTRMTESMSNDLTEWLNTDINAKMYLDEFNQISEEGVSEFRKHTSYNVTMSVINEEIGFLVKFNKLELHPVKSSSFTCKDKNKHYRAYTKHNAHVVRK